MHYNILAGAGLSACLLLTGACASGKVSQSAVTFGTKAAEASSAFVQITETQAAERDADLRASIIRNRINLIITDACQDALFNEKIKPTECDFIPATEVPGVPVALRSEQLKGVAKAMADYGNAIAALAGDFSKEDANLLESFTKFGSAAVNLEATLQGILGTTSAIGADRLNAVTTLVAKLASAALELERERVLINLITTSDVSVQKATEQLSKSMKDLRGVRIGVSARKLSSAEEAYNNALRSGKNLSKPYDAVAKAVAEHRARLAISDPFKALGEAHAQLADAAKSGFNINDLEKFVEKMIDIARSIDVLVSNFETQG